MTHTILRIPAAKTQSGYSRSTIYLRIAQGLWTKAMLIKVHRCRFSNVIRR